MNSIPITGIIGGVGPYAGLDLLSRILSQTRAATDQDHLPLVHLSLPGEIADRSRYLLGESSRSPAAALARQALMAAGLGATLIAIPCNTAHHPAIFNPVAAALAPLEPPVRLVNMISEVRRYLAGRPGGKHVGLLATRGTCATGVYQHWFAGAESRIIVPRPPLDEEVHAAIYDPAWGIKATGRLTGTAAGIISRAAGELARRGARCLLLACTEFSAISASLPPCGLPVVDANTILARAIIGYAAPEKQRPEAAG